MEKGIPEFFEDSVVFITGGSGFIGKVLLEKILRSCPKVKSVYLLMRAKKGVDAKQRLSEIYSLPLFDRLREEQPGIYQEKAKFMEGDVASVGLGLSREDRQFLIDNVNIIFHSAASVRFDQSLKDAVLLNTRGTREICLLALEAKKIAVVLHVSTAYCHTDREFVKEEIYPPHADWAKTIEIAENMERRDMDALAPLYVGKFPNTYTFTKSLAESCVYDLLNGRVRNVVFRPTIVMSVQQEPLPGWIDNFNGSVGLLLACGTGLVRIMYAKDLRGDYMPVDTAVRAILISSWHTATKEEALETKVYTCSSHGFSNLTTYALKELAVDIFWETPLDKSVFYPTNRNTTSVAYYRFMNVLLHVIPGLFFDFILKLCNITPSVMRFHRTMYSSLACLKYFLEGEWTFDNTKTYSLELELNEKDLETFGYKVNEVSDEEYLKQCLIGGKVHLLKESMDNLEKSKVKTRIFYYTGYILDYVKYFLIAYYVLYKWNLIGVIYTHISDYIVSLG